MQDRDRGFYTLVILNFTEDELLRLFKLILKTNTSVFETFSENGEPIHVILWIYEDKVKEFKLAGFKIIYSLVDYSKLR